MTDRSIVKMYHRVKFYARGVEIGVVPEPQTDNKTAKKAKKKRKPSKRGVIDGFSKHARARLRTFLASARPRVEGQYVILGLTLTIPNLSNAELEDEAAGEWASKFREAFHAWGMAITYQFPEVGFIWRVELTQKRMPHVHIVAFVPVSVLEDVHGEGDYTEDYWRRAFFSWLPEVLPDCPGFNFYAHPIVFKWKADKYGRGLWPRLVWEARAAWLRRLEKMGCKSSEAEIRACDARLLTSRNCIHYLCDHTSKRKQAQLGWKGKQWGVLNKSALVFEESAAIDCTPHQYARLVRILRRCYEAHKYSMYLASPNVVAGRDAAYRTIDYIQPRLVGIRGFKGNEFYHWDKEELVRKILEGEFEPI